ncbi:MAG: hypothetical protein AB8B59_12110 [Maribacter sp.]
MQIRIFIFILLLVFANGCQEKVSENSALKETISEIQDTSKNLNYVFTNGFYFTDDLRVDKIGVSQIDENRYKIFYFISDRKHLEKIQDLNIAFRLYPEDPMKFKNSIDQDSKARTIASKCDLKIMEGAFVIASDEFSMIPKKIKESKIYLYKPDDGVLGNTMTILDLNFDF